MQAAVGKQEASTLVADQPRPGHGTAGRTTTAVRPARRWFSTAASHCDAVVGVPGNSCCGLKGTQHRRHYKRTTGRTDEEKPDISTDTDGDTTQPTRKRDFYYRSCCHCWLVESHNGVSLTEQVRDNTSSLARADVLVVGGSERERLSGTTEEIQAFFNRLKTKPQH
jgi:hypothetical protein